MAEAVASAAKMAMACVPASQMTGTTGNSIVFSVMQAFPVPSTGSAAKKRGVQGHSGSDGREAGSTSDDGSGGDAGKPKRSRTAGAAKPRKPSHIMIREEKEMLRKELEVLEARAALLRKRAGLPDAHELTATHHVAQENAVLADALRQQEELVAGAHIALSEFVHLQASNPLEGFVHLGKDLNERSDTVMELKIIKLQQAHRFLSERTRLMNPLTTGMIHEESGVVTSEGDYVLTKLDTTCFRSVESVKQVFDAMKFYFLNLEIANTELTDAITVREDSGLNSVDMNLSNAAVLAHRLVTVLSSGVLLEKSALKFLEYYDGARPDEAYALMAAVPVNQDDLYPYMQSERLRMDMSVAMKLSAFYESSEPHATTSRRLVVVFTRWFRIQLHHNNFVRVPDFVLQDIRRSLSEPMDNVVKSMNQTLYDVPGV